MPKMFSTRWCVSLQESIRERRHAGGDCTYNKTLQREGLLAVCSLQSVLTVCTTPCCRGKVCLQSVICKVFWLYIQQHAAEGRSACSLQSAECSDCTYNTMLQRKGLLAVCSLQCSDCTAVHTTYELSWTNSVELYYWFLKTLFLLTVSKYKVNDLLYKNENLCFGNLFTGRLYIKEIFLRYSRKMGVHLKFFRLYNRDSRNVKVIGLMFH